MDQYRYVRRHHPISVTCILIHASICAASFSATETLDDLTATERAARTHPDAPPRLPPLPFTDHAEEMSRILFAPELIAPPPIVWLPSDNAGVARAEARDLEQFHGLKAVIEVRSSDDVILRRHHHPNGTS
jgi:hypothetical protein